ncbi:hypothetical protein DFJ73DRAFT_863903 [Zopfochytrium polystomum]|nr:hypothetical protein DFJ73DRAFT_863903 [Zopfochytrium polystomum]
MSETFPTRQSFATVLAARQCNAFGLYDDGHEELGLALFPAGSYFNHACESNVGRDVMIRCVDGREGEGGGLVERDALDGLVEAGDEDDGEARAILRAWDREPLMRFVAARDVRRGEELTLSYVDVAQGRDARRKSLKDVYYFDCECARCEREKET